MTELFNRGELSDYLLNRVKSCLRQLDAMPEDEVLARSPDDIVLQLVEVAQIETITIGADAVDGGFTETQVEMYDYFDRERYIAAGLRVHAVLNTRATPNSFITSRRRGYQQDSTRGYWHGTITVQIEQSGSTPDPAATKQAIDRGIGNIRTMAGHAAADVRAFNTTLDGQFRPAVEQRKKFLQDRRDLAGALGFPLKKRTDAPAQVPLRRKAMGVQRSMPAGQEVRIVMSLPLPKPSMKMRSKSSRSRCYQWSAHLR